MSFYEGGFKFVLRVLLGYALQCRTSNDSVSLEIRKLQRQLLTAFSVHVMLLITFLCTYLLTKVSRFS